MSEEKKAIFLKGYFTANELRRIADERMEPEPSQDELWEELDNTCIKVLHNGEVIFLSQEAKKRYRITRI